MIKLDDSPMYIHEDAVKFIKRRLGLSDYIIEKVLEAEFDYMKSIGLAYEIEGDTDDESR